jgi:disease resistance protein RPM1
MKFLELLEPAEGEEAGQLLKVISIVGCPGVGKTALARAVYDHLGEEGCTMDFDCVAWVVASGCHNKMALLGEVLNAVRDKADCAASSADLHALLADKRWSLTD